MKYIPFETYTGKENMSIDEEILNNSIASQEKDGIFRLYAWKPACISLGRNQNDSFIDEDLLAKYSIFLL